MLIAVRNNISCSRTTPHFDRTEYIACRINLHKQPPLKMNASYRPPQNNLETFNDLCNQIESTCNAHKNAVIWTAGDFNLPDLVWDPLSLPAGNNRVHKDINLRAIEFTRQTFQIQQINTPTRDSNILDIFLTNRPTLTIKCKTIP